MEHSMLYTIEIWTYEPGRDAAFIEQWQLQPDGSAKLTFLNGAQPLYPHITGTRPDEGEKYLSKLIHVLRHSSTFVTKQYQK